MAGTIGAINNSSGVVGVAPGIPIYSVRVLNNQGSGSFSSIICGIDWVTANAARLNIKVANMSLGGSGTDDGNCGNSNADAMHKAICTSVAAGVTYVVAAGNSNVDFSGFVPAAYNEVLTVTAAADYNGQPGGGAAATCRAGIDDTPPISATSRLTGSLDARPHDCGARRMHSIRRGKAAATTRFPAPAWLRRTLPEPPRCASAPATALEMPSAGHRQAAVRRLCAVGSLRLCRRSEPTDRRSLLRSPVVSGNLLAPVS